MLQDVWLYPPLAVARVGSGRPLAAFDHGPNDNGSSGTGKTTILPARSLSIGQDGSVLTSEVEDVQFKDGDRVRPVCPFFELHGLVASEEAPMTPDALRALGMGPQDFTWIVRVSNLKPFFRTQQVSDRIDAVVTIQGPDFSLHELRGVSPEGDRSLVPEGDWIPLGCVQLVQPRSDTDVFRFRFYPPRGELYGPTNLDTRVTWRLPRENQRLNPAAYWCQWAPPPDDAREFPPDNYFHNPDDPISLGIVDDISDGIIECKVGETGLTGRSRVVVGPPDFAPDRRHLVSLADGLTDRVRRSEVHQAGFYAVKSTTNRGLTMADEEVRDLMERVSETGSTMNLEALVDLVDHNENASIAYGNDVPQRKDQHFGFSPLAATVNQPFPLTDMGREHHRRMAVLDMLKRYVRQHPKSFRHTIRRPFSNEMFFNRKMPALMRGSDAGPLHLTRRQYDMLLRWAARLEEL